MMTTDATEKIRFIKAQDPESALRLENLLGKQEFLRSGNVYGEKFTDRQFSLVFNPLLEAAYGRSLVLDALSKNDDTVQGLSEKTGLAKDQVFKHLKELMRKNLVEIADHSGRDALFRKK